MGISEKFGEIRMYLKKEDNVIEDIDIFIAAICLVNNLTLVTGNIKHFSKIKGLKLIGFSTVAPKSIARVFK